MPLTRASSRAAILAAIDAGFATSDADALFTRLTSEGALPSGCSAEVFEDLVRELRAEGALSEDGVRSGQRPVDGSSSLHAQPDQDFAQSAIRRRILIVEDDPDSAEMLCELFELKGFEARSAHSGVDALQTAAIFHPTVVLIDLGLPGMDGLAVARGFRAQAEFEQILLVAVTGYESQEHRAAADAAGFDDYLVKPLVFDQVLLTVERARFSRVE